MSSFEVKVYKIKLEPHPNADRLELAIVGDYRSVVMKDQFKNDALIAYIPCGAVLPDWLVKHMNLEGRLAGSRQNRVKEIRLRKILSEGLCLELENFEVDGDNLYFNEGDDLADILCITKYEPKIPTHMGGEGCNVFGHTIKYDIENIKKFPDILQEGEQVTFTEKLHGTWASFGFDPSLNHPDLEDGNVIVTSKGLSGKGIAFKFNEANKHNVYMKAYENTRDLAGVSILDKIKRLAKENYWSFIGPEDAVYICGEIFGDGIQDLHYGLKGETSFRGFDVYVGSWGKGKWLDDHTKDSFFDWIQIPRVPVLYQGPFSKEVLDEYTNGRDTLSDSHVREGIVINVNEERYSNEIGRVFLKSVSEKYLLRKDATEFN